MDDLEQLTAEPRPYPDYVHLGLPWLDAIPKHWKVKRGKTVLRCIDVRSERGEEELLTVSSAHGVIPRRTAAVTMFKAESYAGYKLCWPDDLVINSLWAWGKGLGVSKHHGIVSSAYGVYRLREPAGLLPAYLHTLVRSDPFNWELRVRSKGIWISRLQLTDEAFLDAPILIPPLEEQAAIMRFLAVVDRRVNRFVQAKRRLIELLTEQKQALITHAVTRGLNPHAKLKPSGITWLGDIPEHWEVLPLRRRCRVIDCKHVTVDFVPEGIPLASVREVQSFDIRLANAKRTTREWFERMIEGGRQPRAGDIIYCRNVSVGASAVVNADDVCAMGQDVCLIRHSQHARFLNYYLQSGAMKRQLALVLIGSTFDRINVAEVKDLVSVFPPNSEQAAIAAHLDGAFNGIHDAVARAEREIAVLREYRTRLVADVVTGKLDVRAAAAHLPIHEGEAVDAPELAETIGEEEVDSVDEVVVDDR